MILQRRRYKEGLAGESSRESSTSTGVGADHCFTVHSSSGRVCSRSDRIRSGRDRVRSNGIGYGSGSDRVRSYGDRLHLDLGSRRNRVDRVSIG